VKPLTKTYKAKGSPVPVPNGTPTVGLTDVSGSCDSVSQLSYLYCSPRPTTTPQPLTNPTPSGPAGHSRRRTRMSRSRSPTRSNFCGFSGFSTVHVESPRTAGVTDKPRTPPLSREQMIGIGTGGKNRRTLVRTASSSTRAV
jgi:hypothetical protein